MGTSDRIRLLIVEDVAQVAQHLRALLSAQQQIALLDVVPDGRRAIEVAASVRPDVVVIDALVDGSVRATKVLDAVHSLGLPAVIVTVPQTPVRVDEARGIYAVLTLPFSAFDLVSAVRGAHAASTATSLRSSGRVIAVYSPRGGAGRTTLALNLAAATAGFGRPTVLVDGGLQFGDVRSFLGVPTDATTILDLPTDRITEPDLADALLRDPAGFEVLLAPPRIEQAEMVTSRDIEKTVSLLRRLVEVVVIDLSPGLDETTLAFLDAADVILDIVSVDRSALHATRAVIETFATLGYADRIRFVLNRADAAEAVPAELVAALGRRPEFAVASDPAAAARAAALGRPFVAIEPTSIASADVVDLAAALVGVPTGARRAVGTGAE